MDGPPGLDKTQAVFTIVAEATRFAFIEEGVKSLISGCGQAVDCEDLVELLPLCFWEGILFLCSVDACITGP